MSSERQPDQVEKPPATTGAEVAAPVAQAADVTEKRGHELILKADADKAASVDKDKLTKLTITGAGTSPGDTAPQDAEKQKVPKKPEPEPGAEKNGEGNRVQKDGKGTTTFHESGHVERVEGTGDQQVRHTWHKDGSYERLDGQPVKDAKGQEIKDAQGRPQYRSEFRVDANGNRSGREGDTTWTRSADGQISTQTTGDTTTTWDSRANTTTVANARTGDRTVYDGTQPPKDGERPVILERREATDKPGEFRTVTYDRATAGTDNPRINSITTEKPDGSSDRYTYDANGNPTTHTRTDARVVTGTNPDGTQNWSAESRTYDLTRKDPKTGEPLLTSTGWEDNKGNSLRHDYDEKGQVKGSTTVQVHDNGRTETRYNGDGRPTYVAETNKEGNRVDITEYDGRSGAITSRSASELRDRYVQDSTGQQVKQGQEWVTEKYTPEGKRVSETTADLQGRTTAIREFEVSGARAGQLKAETQFLPSGTLRTEFPNDTQSRSIYTSNDGRSQTVSNFTRTPDGKDRLDNFTSTTVGPDGRRTTLSGTRAQNGDYQVRVNGGEPHRIDASTINRAVAGPAADRANPGRGSGDAGRAGDPRRPGVPPELTAALKAAGAPPAVAENLGRSLTHVERAARGAEAGTTRVGDRTTHPSPAEIARRATEPRPGGELRGGIPAPVREPRTAAELTAARGEFAKRVGAPADLRAEPRTGSVVHDTRRAGEVAPPRVGRDGTPIKDGATPIPTRVGEPVTHPRGATPDRITPPGTPVDRITPPGRGPGEVGRAPGEAGRVLPTDARVPGDGRVAPITDGRGGVIPPGATAAERQRNAAEIAKVGAGLNREGTGRLDTPTDKAGPTIPTTDKVAFATGRQALDQIAKGTPDQVAAARAELANLRGNDGRLIFDAKQQEKINTLTPDQASAVLKASEKSGTLDFTRLLPTSSQFQRTSLEGTRVGALDGTAIGKVGDNGALGQAALGQADRNITGWAIGKNGELIQPGARPDGTRLSDLASLTGKDAALAGRDGLLKDQSAVKDLGKIDNTLTTGRTQQDIGKIDNTNTLGKADAKADVQQAKLDQANLDQKQTVRDQTVRAGTEAAARPEVKPATDTKVANTEVNTNTRVQDNVVRQDNKATTTAAAETNTGRNNLEPQRGISKSETSQTEQSTKAIDSRIDRNKDFGVKEPTTKSDKDVRSTQVDQPIFTPYIDRPIKSNGKVETDGVDFGDNSSGQQDPSIFGGQAGKGIASSDPNDPNNNDPNNSNNNYPQQDPYAVNSSSQDPNNNYQQNSYEPQPLPDVQLHDYSVYGDREGLPSGSFNDTNYSTDNRGQETTISSSTWSPSNTDISHDTGRSDNTVSSNWQSTNNSDIQQQTRHDDPAGIFGDRDASFNHAVAGAQNSWSTSDNSSNTGITHVTNDPVQHSSSGDGSFSGREPAPPIASNDSTGHIGPDISHGNPSGGAWDARGTDAANGFSTSDYNTGAVTWGANDLTMGGGPYIPPGGWQGGNEPGIPGGGIIGGIDLGNGTGFNGGDFNGIPYIPGIDFNPHTGDFNSSTVQPGDVSPIYSDPYSGQPSPIYNDPYGTNPDPYALNQNQINDPYANPYNDPYANPYNNPTNYIDSNGNIHTEYDPYHNVAENYINPLQNQLGDHSEYIDQLHGQNIAANPLDNSLHPDEFNTNNYHTDVFGSILNGGNEYGPNFNPLAETDILGHMADMIGIGTGTGIGQDSHETTQDQNIIQDITNIFGNIDHALDDTLTSFLPDELASDLNSQFGSATGFVDEMNNFFLGEENNSIFSGIDDFATNTNISDLLNESDFGVLNPLTENIDPFDLNSTNNMDGNDPAHQLMALLQTQKDHDEHEHKLKEERERLEREHELAEKKAKEFAEAMLAAARAQERAQRELAEARRQKELAEAEAKKQKDWLTLTERKRYVTLANDTLESIAKKMLKDASLAELIYELNKNKIKREFIDGKVVYTIAPRTVLQLPSKLDIERYKTRKVQESARNKNRPNFALRNKDNKNKTDVLVSSNSLDSSSSSNSATTAETETTTNESEERKDDAASQRRSNVESLLGKMQQAAEPNRGIQYNCRLGDTLRSVALRHPALRDVNLWRLIAEINNLSADVDDSGVPISSLKRGSQIILPTEQQIKEFRARNSKEELNIVSEKIKNSTSETEITKKDSIDPEEYQKDSESGIAANKEEIKSIYTVPSELLGSVVNLKENAESSVPESITLLSNKCRIVRSGNMLDNSVPFYSQLEILNNDKWTAVLVYEITEEGSFRYDIDHTGSKKSRSILLPARAAKQMAETDINRNWNKYFEDFILAIC